MKAPNPKGNIAPEILPVIPTMDIVVFPRMIIPLLVLDERIIEGINRAFKSTKKVLLLAAKKHVDNYQEAIGVEDLYAVGTVGTIMRVIPMPEGGMKVLVQGVSRARVKEILTEDGVFSVAIDALDFKKSESNDIEIEAQIKNIKSLADQMAASGKTISPDFHIMLSKLQDVEKIIDFVLSHLNIAVAQSQELLEICTEGNLLNKVYELLQKEVAISEVQEQIRNNARELMGKSQKEYYLREQIKAIKQELGDNDVEEVGKMRQRVEGLQMPEEARLEIDRQINRLESMAPDSVEATVIRNYLDWVLSLPWNIETQDNLDMSHAKKVLDEDHYGLHDIKERILDFISIRKLSHDNNAPIICFVGPPGTGKTSLGKSIARCLGRNYYRVSLGGVKDEAEIRGHRRTYVGAMPGRFIQGLRKAGSCNPVIIIDELDKIGADFRGDPSAALLELLDTQQNKAFYDNYLGVPFDFSKIIFIATANSLDTISDPLKDRMEMIPLTGYSVEEKLNIAKGHLINRAIVDSGLDGHGVAFTDQVLQDIVLNYTRESGVRQLDRILRTLCAKIARLFVEANQVLEITAKNIEKYLGPRKFIEDDISKESLIGITNGLAWTIYGGEMIKIEAVLMPGRGNLILTGHLGEVMKESAQAALSYARVHSKEFGINDRIFTNHDLHIHVPAGAVPKDGPSAGITMLTSVLSVLTQRPVNADYALTGELNLRGDVMPIGGVKEKVLAAKRNGISHIILPFKNKNDIVGIEEAIKGIDVVWVNHAEEVMKYILLPTDKRVRH